MDYPSSLIGIVRRAATEHRDDIDQAVDCAEEAWLNVPEHAEWVKAMVRAELRHLIHDVRHRENVAIRHELGYYGGPAKVANATGAVERVARNCLIDYSIGGIALGKITGKLLKSLAKSEQEKSDGYAYNARLCVRLATLVPDDKTVAECLSVKQADTIMKEVAGVRRTKRQQLASA